MERFSYYRSEKLTTAIPSRYIGLQKRMGGRRVGVISSRFRSSGCGVVRKVGPARKLVLEFRL